MGVRWGGLGDFTWNDRRLSLTTSFSLHVILSFEELCSSFPSIIKPADCLL